MRKWILAAVAALAVGQAEARTYTLTFTSADAPWLKSWITFDYQPGTTSGAGNTELEDNYCAYTPYAIACGGYTSDAATLFWGNASVYPDYGDISLEWDDGLMTGGGTAYGYWEGPLHNGQTFAGEYFGYAGEWVGMNDWIQTEDIYYAGQWSVTSPVPLPATAPLLLGAVGFLGWVRGRGSRRARPTSAG